MSILTLQKQRRLVRSPINPLDKSTIISILPKEVDEKKPTIMPGRFIIPPGTFDKPSVLVVASSSWWREIDESQPPIEVPCSSIQVADSVVTDYCNGLLACNMHDKRPGLFFVPGELTPERVKKEHLQLVLKYQQYQRNWFGELIKMADVMWARTNGNPLAVSDDARLACHELGILDKPWLKDFQSMQMVKCVACGSLKNPDYPVCSVCRAVTDVKKAESLNIKFAV